MAVEIVTDWKHLVRHRDAWASLLARSSANGPMLTPVWLETWWQEFGREGGRQLCAVLYFEGARLIGLAPLLVRRFWYRGALPLRRLELLATGEPQADEICSEYLNFIAESGREQQVAHAVIDALVRGALGKWDELILDAMAAESPMTQAIVAELGRVHIPTEVRALRPCPYIPLPDSWEAYLSQLSSSRRYFIRRTLRDFKKWAGDDITVRRAESAADLAEGQRILIELHNQRWQQDGHGGVFHSPRFLRFHRRVMAAFLPSDNLDLIWLCTRERPVAAVYNLVWDNHVYFYQAGRCPAVPAKIRPGIALHAYAIQHAISCGRKRYDFLAGASRYKKQLSLDETPLVQVQATRPGALPILARQWVRGAESVARTLSGHIDARLAARRRANPSQNS